MKQENMINSNEVNNYADIMINRISIMIEDMMKKVTYLDSAIVDKVNSDGTVDVYFPPDNNKIFTRISNQTPYALSVGDSVEILLKNGSYSNCWVIAKHGEKGKVEENNNLAITQTGMNNLEGRVEELERVLNDISAEGAINCSYKDGTLEFYSIT